MVDNLTNLQLQEALRFLYSPTSGKIPEISKSLTETQWVAIELVATQLQEERAEATLH